jgi:3-ketosteroid 9alpha-monooxygenase subunit A
MILINSHIPIEDDKLLLRFGVVLKAGKGVTLPPEVLGAHVAAARNGYFEDVAIWENKRWRDQPLLTDGDGPIGEVRKWYASFFSDSVASPTRSMR